MGFCESKLWSMTLKLDKDNNDPNKIERLGFNLIVVGGEITGDVITSEPKRMSKIRGRCESVALPGLPELSRMSFVFRFRRGTVERGVVLAGFAYLPAASAQPIFEGRLRVFDFDPDLPTSGDGQLQKLSGDPGDTGTGTGQQT